MCPVCHEPLVVFELQGVEIDRCVVCGGTWLDAGELEQISELAGAQPGGLSVALEAAGEGKHGKRRCPRCNAKLRIVHLGQSPVVEIDRCPRGHGLWFDSREMQTLIEAFADGGEEKAVAAFFGDLFRHDLSKQAEGG